MQPTAYPIQDELLDKAWRSFVETGRVDKSVQGYLDPAILRSGTKDRVL